MRSICTLVALCFGSCLAAQSMDSVHVFRRVPAGVYTSAQANALAWRLHREDAPHRTVKGSEIDVVREAMSTYRPQRHTSGTLPDLTHVAIAFRGGRPMAFGVADDLGLLVNFTARTEYHISSWTEHLTVRALLSKLLVQ
jgi:hypothetical protein